VTRRIIRSLLALLLLVAVGLAFFLFIFMRPLPVEVARPSNHVPVEVFGLGTVEARILSQVGFETGAALVELTADHGDQVKEGDVLARLHSAEQEARVAKAKAGMVNAEAAVRMAEAAVGKARAVLAQKKQANKRKQALVARQTVSVEVAEEAQMEEDVAAAELAVAASDVEVAKAALDDAQAQHELERVLLEHHVLRAPYDATIVERHKELGAVLAAGEALYTLVAPETVWVLAYVDEARAGGIRVGQPAEVRLRSLPRQMFQGRVARIGIESDRVSEERRVYVACERCPESFHLGEQAEVLITTAVLENALLVPETVVEGFDGTRGRVWTVEDGELGRREVAFGDKTLDSRLKLSRVCPTARWFCARSVQGCGKAAPRP
jgi:HlyD family secretion protein